MSKEYTNCLRGIFAVLVVVHHLYQYSGLFAGTYIGAILQLLGFVSVAMFFFFSGYGLMFSSEKNDYIEKFFRKRFIPLYCFYVFLIALYSIWTILVDKSIALGLVARSFAFGGTIVTNGWYLQATFVAYLIYLFVFKTFKSAKRRVTFFGVGILLYLFACVLIGYGITWYQTIPCMVLGMVFCYAKNGIDKLLNKYAWLIFITSGMLFAGCYLLSKIIAVKIMFDVLYSLFFVIAMIALAYILGNTALINNKFWALFGKYSLEIYVSHGLFLRFISLGYIKNVYVYILVVIVGTILSSLLLKKVYQTIIKLFEGGRSKVV